MIGKKVKVHSGKHAGKTGTVINNLHTQNSWKVRRDGESGVSNETFQVAKYYVEEVVDRAPRVLAKQSTEEQFLGKWVSFDTSDAIETSRDAEHAAFGMRSLVTDVWREDGRWLANVVFLGKHAVVPVDSIAIDSDQYKGGSEV